MQLLAHLCIAYCSEQATSLLSLRNLRAFPSNARLQRPLENINIVQEQHRINASIMHSFFSIWNAEKVS